LLNHERACDLADALAAVPGVSVATPRFFNEFTLQVQRPAKEVLAGLTARGILGGVEYSRLAPAAGRHDLIIVAATERNTQEDIAAYATALREVMT
jgi:glycine dehydrogenase subunit 1